MLAKSIETDLTFLDKDALTAFCRTKRKIKTRLRIDLSLS